MVVDYSVIHWKMVHEEGYESSHGAQVLKKQLRSVARRVADDNSLNEVGGGIGAAKVSPESEGGEVEENKDNETGLKAENRKLLEEIESKDKEIELQKLE